MAEPTLITDATAALLRQLWESSQTLPEPVVRRAQRLWLDTVSCAFSGLQAA